MNRQFLVVSALALSHVMCVSEADREPAHVDVSDSSAADSSGLNDASSDADVTDRDISNDQDDADVAEDRGCVTTWNSGLSRAGFRNPLAWPAYGLTDLNPVEEITFWELLPYGHNHDWGVFAASGPACPADDEGTCQDSYLEAKQNARDLEYNWPFEAGTLTLIVRGEEGFKSFDTRESLLAFFGTIDTELEAILWARNNGHWTGPIRSTDTGYEIIESTLDSACAPVIESERNLFVDADGALRRGEEYAVVSVECGSCI